MNNIKRDNGGQASPILARLRFYSYSFYCKQINIPAPAGYAQGRFIPTTGCVAK